MTVASGREAASTGVVRGQQTFWSGVAMVALAVAALWFTRDIPQGTLRAMGPAMLPRGLAIGVGLCGLILLLVSLRPAIGRLVGFGLLAVAAAGFVAGSLLSREGAYLLMSLALLVAVPVLGIVSSGEADDARLGRSAVRGPAFVVLGVLLFAVTIRGLGPLPGLGMIVAGPLAILVSGLGSPEARWGELIVLSLALTAGCMILFGDLLNLPIPLFPNALGDLFPASFTNDGRLRATAGLLFVAALAVYLAGRAARPRAAAEHEPIDVADHSGRI